MEKVKKNAWLIGLYTMDVEAKVESLGYKITRLITDLQHCAPEENPSLIVFCDDYFKTMESMSIAKVFFPQALLMSLPSGVEFSKNQSAPINKPDPSVQRLLTSIKEREYRWDN
jgi:hypothetical protein